MEDENNRKAENLLLAVGVAVITAVWLTGGKVMREAVRDALQATGVIAATKAWAELVLGVVLVSFLAATSWVPLAAMRKIIVAEFSKFKARRLDWWLEARGGKHVNAELLLAFVVWTCLVGLMVWLRYE